MWESRQSNGSESSESNFALDWFENRLNEVRTEVENLMSQFRLSEALKTIYSLIWDDFCSWYLEWIKPGFEETISRYVYLKTVKLFDDLLQLLHPFMPFITEEIYHLLKDRDDDMVVKQFLSIGSIDATILQQGNRLKEIISAIRDTRNKHNIRQKETIKLHIETNDKEQYRAIKNILAKQINAENIEFSSQPENAFISIVAGKEKIYIETNIEVDVVAQKEKLSKDLKYLKGFLISIDKKLSNDRFVQNAKTEVIDLERKKKSDAEAKILIIEQTLSSLE
jgi:valyl-tRNA synthetase